MSYKALYRKYRPNTFEEVIGQDHVLSIMKNIVEKEKVGHAYLFSGPRGTGKTTVAHLFAKEINKEHFNFEEKREVLDIIEIDAASNNGVAEIRELIESSKYAPSVLKFKVYIIDEAHMLTKSAFNALLKTLEEPPKHVVFVLATTEPEKIPITVLSRLQRFNFKRIGKRNIANQLSKILKKEGISFEKEALKIISQISYGGMRDAISIADQISAYGDGIVNEKNVSKVLGLVLNSEQISLINLIFNSETKKMLILAHEFFNSGVDIEKLSISLIDILKDFIIFDKTLDPTLMEKIDAEERDLINISIDFAYKAIDSLIGLLSELKFSQSPYQSFELTLLKLVNIRSKEIIEISVNDKKNENFEIEKKELKNISNAKIQESNIKIKNSEKSKITKETNQFNEKITQESTSQEADKETTINLLDMISKTQKEKNSETSTNDFSKEFIINLLIQTNKEEMPKAKSALDEVGLYDKDTMTSTYSSLLSKMSIISKGHNFILLTSRDNFAVENLKKEVIKNSFLLFINKVFNQELNVFVISYEEFNEVKNAYSKLASSKKLPKPKKINKPKIKEEEPTDAELIGANLFGELFSK